MSALHFSRLRVSRMPGIRDGGWTLDELSPGLNVLYGPNGSGKTTSGNALQALLWPAIAPQEATLVGQFTLDGVSWSAEVDGRHARYQREGQECGAPTLIPSDTRDRYRLSLHELLLSDNRDLAAEIVRESAGGYDVEAAAAELGLRRVRTRAEPQVAAVQEARQRLSDARARQEALRAEEQTLQELERRAAAARAAGQRAKLLERAVEHARALETERAIRGELDGYPAALQQLHGDERERLDRIDARLESVRAVLREAEGARERALQEARGSGLPEAGLPGELLSAARAEAQALREQEQELERLDQALCAANRRCEDELEALRGAVDGERLGRLNHAAMGELAAFAREAAEQQARLHAVEAELRWLGQDHPRDDQERLEAASRLLRQWLRSPGGAPGERRRLRLLGLGAAGTLLVVALVGSLYHPAPLGLALLAVVLLWLIARADVADDARATYRKDFDALGLEGPGAWHVGEVERCLDTLTRQVVEGRVAGEKALLRRDAEKRAEMLRAAMARLEERRRELVDRLGVAPDLEEGHLYWLVTRLVPWQDAQRDASAAAAALEAGHASYADRLAQAGERLAPFGYAVPACAADALGAVEDLDRRARAQRDALERARAEEARLSTCRQELEAKEAERHQLLQALGLSEEQEEELAALCAQHGRYREACELLLRAQGQRESAAAQLAAAGAAPEFFERPAAELEAERDAASAEAQALEGLQERITAVRTRVDDAKRGHDLEDALAAVERAEQALRAVRERSALAAVGETLVEFVQRAARDRNRPEVFHRARQLFLRITHGRYRLEFSEQGGPAFRAVDTTEGTGHSLDELSSATRVQLLMAVRVAFVERQEQGMRLPLVFDETLANSDDHRAEAIMQGVLELAAEGRQVFYLTAQADEVAKWKALLERRPDVPSRFLDLAEARRRERYLDLQSLRGLRPSAPRPPQPDGLSHQEYGERLLVPPLAAGEAGASGVHLWHLLESPQELHRVLCLGVDTWGALQALVEHGGGELIPSDTYRRAQAAARAADEALRLGRIGRGRRVERATLVASGSVSERFMEQVSALCERVGGDAQLLLAELERGAVPRFQARTRESLQEYLEEHGYLDPRDPLPPEQLRVRVLAAVARELEQELISHEQVDAILARCLEDAPATE